MSKKRLKIAFINIYQGVSKRGGERFVTELSRRLKGSYDVDVLTTNVKQKTRLPIIWRTYLDPFGLQTFFQTLRLLPKVWRNKYDIIIPVNGGWQPAILRIVTWLYGGKMFISGQSGVGWDDRNNLWCFPNCFIALSTHALGWAKRVNPLVKSIYIPNGVDLKEFNILEGGKAQKEKSQKTVLSVGAFVEEKRLDLAIRAVSKLDQVKLILVGSHGKKEKDLYRLGHKLLGKNQFEIKTVDPIKMPGIYRSADVFTFPSKSSEAFGNVLVEAMACGLPVVATEDPIRKEIVGDAGFFVDPEDTSSFTEALNEALKIDWGNKPRLQAEKFSWDMIAKSYEKIFD